MKLEEAWETLELSKDTAPEETKKRYREFAKKYHPDINKEPNAEERFKKINEAYHCIQTGKGTDPEESTINPFDFININFNPFGRQNHSIRNGVEPIHSSTTISFQESILGCKRDIKFSRKIKCPECDGHGEINLNNGCTKCGGRGQVTNKNGNMIFVQTCDKCYGRSQKKSCNKCSSTGLLDSDMSVQVTIPGGVINNNILKLSGMGHFVGDFMGIQQHSDVFLNITVINEQGLSIHESDVISELNISLLEALCGCKKTIKTVLGDKEINIKSKSKNKDEVVLKKLGVNRIGNQRVILNIEYPENIDKLIKVLANEEN